jgi:hypothetical protein
VAVKLFVIIVLVLLLAALINWVRQGAGFPIVQTLPLLGGKEPSVLWDGAAIVMLAITAWGIRRVARRHSEP